MTSTVFTFCLAVFLTAAVVAVVGWLATVGGGAVMLFLRQSPDGVSWIRLLTPALPLVSLSGFSYIMWARRRKAEAEVGSIAER